MFCFTGQNVLYGAIFLKKIYGKLFFITTILNSLERSPTHLGKNVALSVISHN